MTRPREGEAAAAPAVPERALATLQEQLLDIGNRNRLINTPVGSPRAKQIRVVDELADELFQILYRNGRAMSFEPADDVSDEFSVHHLIQQYVVRCRIQPIYKGVQTD